MSQERRRRRFQFHLSTGVVLMLVAGGLIWINLGVRSGTLSWSEGTRGRLHIQMAELGWPYAFVWTARSAPPTDTAQSDSKLRASALKEVSSADLITHANSRDFRLTEALDDLFVAVLILALAFGAWEGVLRLRSFLRTEPEEIESGG